MSNLLNDRSIVYMVNTRGRVIEAHVWEIDNLKLQGCRMVNNPKEEYMPQYDLAVTTTPRPGNIEEEKENDTLPCEVLS